MNSFGLVPSGKHNYNGNLMHMRCNKPEGKGGQISGSKLLTVS